MDLLYPLKFKPIYKERIWGGSEIASKFARQLPMDKFIGEAWELSDYPGDESEVAEGVFAGQSISDLVKKYKTAITGTLSTTAYFPLLVKILDPADKLSVQVHPDNKLAQQLEGTATGKTEMWFVLEAKPDSMVVCGTSKNVSNAEFKEHVQNETLGEILNKVSIEKDDVIFIPAKTVHAILPGMLLLEIQQTSDITYRLYDWGRVDRKTGLERELHVEKGIKSSELNFSGNHKCETVFKDVGNGNLRASILQSDYFYFDRLKIAKNMCFSGDGSTFNIVFCLGQECSIEYSDNKPAVFLTYGELALVPAGLKNFSISGLDADVALIYLGK